MKTSFPDDWIGQQATIQFKTGVYIEGEPWGVGVVDGRIEEKTDYGIVIKVSVMRGSTDRNERMFIAYDALVTIDVSD